MHKATPNNIRQASWKYKGAIANHEDESARIQNNYNEVKEIQ